MWKRKSAYAVGGLTEIGFSHNDEYILVVSSNGRGIFSCKTGEKIARDYHDEYTHDYETGIVEGFGVLAGEDISCCGLDTPDFLKKETTDGWKIVITEPEPDEPPFERYLVHRLYLQQIQTDEQIYVTKDSACELRAYGFSSNEHTLVVATSCDLEIWTKQDV